MFRLFKAPGLPIRTRIVRALLQQELCVCEITEWLDCSRPAVSQHLRRLRETGLVESSRRGQWTFYRSHFEPLKTAIRQLGLCLQSAVGTDPLEPEFDRELTRIKQQNL